MEFSLPDLTKIKWLADPCVYKILDPGIANHGLEIRNNQFTALVSAHLSEQIPLQLLLLKLLEVAGIQRKIIRMILTPVNPEARGLVQDGSPPD